MNKILLSCSMLFGVMASAQIVVNEKFEGASLSVGWESYLDETLTAPVSTYLDNSSGVPCEGNQTANANLYYYFPSYYLVYSSTASNGTEMAYSFKYLATSYSLYSSVEGTVSADYSIDGGVTWVDLLAPVSIVTSDGGSIPCTTVSGTIPSGTIPSGTDFKFRLKAVATGAGDYYMGFDDIQLLQAVTSAPGCTTVTDPVSGVTGVSVTPLISYGGVQGAYSYLINIGTASGGTDVLNAYDNGSGTSYQISSANPLLYNTTYYVSVNPSNNVGSASGCSEISFTTGDIPCPTVTQPIAAATNVTARPTFVWDSVPGAGYYLTVGTTAGGNDVLDNLDVGNATSYTLSTPLNILTQYFYTVKSYQGTNVSSGCAEGSFTTGAIPSPPNDECSAPIALIPGNSFATNALTTTNLGASTTSDTTAVTPCQTNSHYDVWYSVVVPASGEITIETKGVSGSNFMDSVLGVYSGTCGALTLVGCDDDGGDGTHALVTLTGQTPGETLLIAVFKYGSSTNTMGEFQISAYDASLSTMDVVANAKDVMVYPNPFVDMLHVSDVKDLVSMVVTDMAGRTVKTIVKPDAQVYLGDLKSGLYLVTLKYKDGTSKTIKSVKK